MAGYCGSKKLHGDDGNLDQSSNFDILESERETVAAYVLACVCRSMSSEAMSGEIIASEDIEPQIVSQVGDDCNQTGQNGGWVNNQTVSQVKLHSWRWLNNRWW